MGDQVIPVRVALRIRPLVTKELAQGEQSVLYQVEGRPQVSIKEHLFTYDFVFGPEAPQSSIFETAAKKLVSKILEGFNVTILAYGQTGSGKTFTMGTSDSSGIIQQAVQYLFTKMGEETDVTFEIKVSFLELYVEKFYDLLSDNRVERGFREDPNTGFSITGLTETTVTTWQEALECLQRGSAKRKTGSTAMNEQSSRSHAVFTLTINQRSKESKRMVKSSKFRLVDLAGSERLSKTQAVGVTLDEGIKINTSLLTLGNVISALGEAIVRHVPYRDSKLTRLLEDSLGGNSHTLMIACASPAASNHDETICTLRYADRARKIKNKPIAYKDPVLNENLRLHARVTDLERQLEMSKNETENLRSAAVQLPPAVEGNTAYPVVEMDLLRSQIQNLEGVIKNLQLKPIGLPIVNQDPTQVELTQLRALLAQYQSAGAGSGTANSAEVEQMKQQLLLSEEKNLKLMDDLQSAEAANQEMKQRLEELQAQAEQTGPFNRLAQDQPYSVVKAEYDAVVHELEKQVTSLQQEKHVLTVFLTHANTRSVANAQLAESRLVKLWNASEKIPNHSGSLVAKLTTVKEKLQQQLNIALKKIQELKAQPPGVIEKNAAELFRRFPHLDETIVALNRNALVISELTEMFSSSSSQREEEGFAPSSMRKNLITSRPHPSSSIQNSEGEVAEQDPNDTQYQSAGAGSGTANSAEVEEMKRQLDVNTSGEDPQPALEIQVLEDESPLVEAAEQDLNNNDPDCKDRI